MEAENTLKSDNLDYQLNISVIIPMHNGAATICRCLEALQVSENQAFEIIVVDDSSTDGSALLIKAYPVQILSLEGGGPFGPAYARNQGAAIAKGDILLFLDADVLVHRDTLTRIAQHLTRHPEYDAMFGSYDDTPGEGEFLSQYKNLSHHFVHQSAKEEGQTFWAGCGAVRREAFMAMGGFDAVRYPRPSIEDIAFGYRLKSAGCKIFVDKDAQVTHLKRWTLMGLLKTDFFHRALPWTSLIFQEGGLPDDLNLEKSQRFSAIMLVVIFVFLILTAQYELIFQLVLLVVLSMLLLGSCELGEGTRLLSIGASQIATNMIMLILLGVITYFQNLMALLVILSVELLVFLAGRILPIYNPRLKRVLFSCLVCGLVLSFSIMLFGASPWVGMTVSAMVVVILLLNRRQYLFFTRKRGLFFALGAIPFHLFYFFYSLVAFGLGAIMYLWDSKLKPG